MQQKQLYKIPRNLKIQNSKNSTSQRGGTREVQPWQICTENSFIPDKSALKTQFAWQICTKILKTLTNLHWKLILPDKSAQKSAQKNPICLTNLQSLHRWSPPFPTTQNFWIPPQVPKCPMTCCNVFISWFGIFVQLCETVRVVLSTESCQVVKDQAITKTSILSAICIETNTSVSIGYLYRNQH